MLYNVKPLHLPSQAFFFKKKAIFVVKPFKNLVKSFGISSLLKNFHMLFRASAEGPALSFCGITLFRKKFNY